MSSNTTKLIIDVMDGNPGALTIIRSLLELPTWHQLLHHLKNNWLVGSELWRMVKDDYNHNVAWFVADQLAQMAPKRAHALYALTLQPGTFT